MIKAILIGLVWGVVCGIANGLPGVTTLVQMAVPWVWVAAFVAFREADNRRLAAFVGALTLLAANVAYLSVGSIGRGIAGLSLVDGVRFFALWSAVGLVVGPLAGVVGWWLTQRNPFTGVVTLATVSVAEPLALWTHIDHLDTHLAYVGVALAGLAFPLVWFRRPNRIRQVPRPS